MNKLSVFILAYNQADKIADSINSILWADEIILVDSHSTDGTDTIAEQLGAKVVQVEFQGFGHLRNQAIAACSHDWIFSLDSDERCTPEAKAEILDVINREDAKDAYLMPRKNFFMGQWIKYSWPYPNYRQPQLFRKDRMAYDSLPVHEGYILKDPKSLEHLQQSIWQIPFMNLEEILYKADRYSSLGAEKCKNNQQKPSMWKAFTHSIYSFVKHYFVKRGCLDGWAGLIIAFNYAEQTFYRYAKHYANHLDSEPKSL